MKERRVAQARPRMYLSFVSFSLAEVKACFSFLFVGGVAVPL